MRAWARAAGLSEVRITSSSWTYADAAACRWWGRSQADRISGRAFTEQALGVGASHEDVADIARAWRRWEEEPDAWFLLPHVEILARGTGAGPHR